MSTRIEKVATVCAVLLACVLCAMPANAQRGGAINGGGMIFGGNPGVGAARGGAHAGGAFRGGRHGGHNRGGDLIVAPFWYGGWDGWYDQPYDYGYAPPEGPPTQTVIMQPPPPPEPVRIPSDPKVVEVPGAAKAAAPKKLPRAVFVLNNGERIESQQYLITADQVQLTAERRLRKIPLSQIDLEATLAAARERGIDLHIPSGGGEISLGF